MGEETESRRPPTPSPLGGLRGLLESHRHAAAADLDCVVAVVTATSGSTYRRPGAMALLDGVGLRAGALSGGCLEPELERRARIVLAERRGARASFDTQAGEDRVFGSGLGCRGRIETLLLPIPARSGAHALAALERAFARRDVLRLSLSLDDATLGAGAGEVGPDTERLAWRADGFASNDGETGWRAGVTVSLSIPPPPALLLLGAGPETPVLVGFARRMGYETTVVDHRRRWADPAEASGADAVLVSRPEEAHAALSTRAFGAIVVMSHSYELDLEHVRLWLGASSSASRFVGLLGPSARRDELLREAGLSLADVEGRLQGPVGLPLGGHGPEAIALSIASQVQQRFASEGLLGG